ncbi:hypothetical protein L218DRAFT_224489 [Marasmius fiardii PR-910]|nr:hypothetical protein L218DRAFT_224489 [Marasmius fiardii PR-910]
MDLLAEEAEDLGNATSSTSNGSFETTAPLASRFLDLFEQVPHCLDISDSRWYFGKKYGADHAGRVVSHLWAAYLSRKKKEHDGAIWVYDHRSQNAEEQQKIIRSLGMTSVSPPDGLLDIFKDYKLVRTPDEEQKRRFKNLDDTTSTSFEGKFSAHVQHLINVARDCHPNLCGRLCRWKRAQDVDVDLTQPQQVDNQGENHELKNSFDLDVFISDNTLFLNDRNLSFDYVHSEEKGGPINCPAFDAVNDIDVDSIVCDCSVQDLMNQIIQDCDPKASRKQPSGYLRNMHNMLFLFPRNLTFSFRSSDNSHVHPVEATLNWTTQMHDTSNFIVEVRSGEWTLQNTIKDPDIMSSQDATSIMVSEDRGSIVRGKEMRDEETRKEPPQQVDVERSSSGEEGSGTNQEGTVVEEMGNEHDDHEGMTSIFLTTVDPSITLPNLKPGETYTIQVCARRPTRVAYSVPTLFRCPLDRVHNISAEVSSEILKVSFDPVIKAVNYIITLS